MRVAHGWSRWTGTFLWIRGDVSRTAQQKVPPWRAVVHIFHIPRAELEFSPIHPQLVHNLPPVTHRPGAGWPQEAHRFAHNPIGGDGNRAAFPQGLGTTTGTTVDGGVDYERLLWTTSGEAEVVHDPFSPSTDHSQCSSTVGEAL